MPNVGKSTLFKALTKRQVDCANYPFCTIDPNVGVVAVPDERLKKLTAISKSVKTIPATVEFVDIAGLVAGASKGEGLGNKFLANIREVDAIAHVVRCFEDKNVVHVSGRVDPRSDTEIINLELIYADLATVEKRLESLRKEMKSGISFETKILFEAAQKVLAVLNKGYAAISAELSEEEIKSLGDLHLLTMKPVIYILNVGENAAGGDFHLDFLPGNAQLALSIKLEAELSELTEASAGQMLLELGLKEGGLDRLIRAGYHLLRLITFFTSGPKETRAWTIKKGAKAPEAAGVIHTDFEKGFIRAEVVSYNDFMECGGEIGARERGKLRLEGKEYVIQDGDICHFRFAV